MAYDWLIMRSFHCPNLGEIGCNADLLSKIALPVGSDRWILARAGNELTFHAKGFFVSKPLNWHQKWVTDIRLVVRRVLPGRRIVVSFWTKYAVRSQIKPGILKLTLRRGQFNFNIVYIFISCEENGIFRAVLLGQLSFDCRSYFERRRRMQGVSPRG